MHQEWDDAVRAAAPALRELLDWQRRPAELPVWSSRPDLHDRRLAPTPLPADGQPLAEVLDDLVADLRDGYCNGAHPGYFGYFHPRPLPAAVIGDAVAALLNQSPAAWRMGPAATAIEAETAAWLADFTGFGRAEYGLSGVFTSGGSTANLAALKVARDLGLGREVQDTGLGERGTGATFYASAGCHYSVPRALDLLGVGRGALRTAPVDRLGRVAVPALRALVEEDVAAGRRPVAVIGLAGTSATGAVDDLDQLADLAAQHHLWFHVDAAAGGPFAGLPETRSVFRGLERADSMTLDPHKWMFVPYGVGCLLVRDHRELTRSFDGDADYWRHEDELDTVFMTPEGSRPWKSLGLWLAVRHLGRSGYQELLRRNLTTARRLAMEVRTRDGFELLDEPVTPVCCFRVLPPPGSARDIDDYNEQLAGALRDRGTHYVTTVRPGGDTYLRAAVNNWASGESDVISLVDSLADLRDTAL